MQIIQTSSGVLHAQSNNCLSDRIGPAPVGPFASYDFIWCDIDDEPVDLTGWSARMDIARLGTSGTIISMYTYLHNSKSSGIIDSMVIMSRAVTPRAKVQPVEPPPPTPEPGPLSPAPTLTVSAESFSPLVVLHAGASSSISWTDEDGEILATGLTPSIAFENEGPHIVRMVPENPEDVRTLNLGFHHAQDSGLVNLPSSQNHPCQGVTSIEGLPLLPMLEHFMAARTNGSSSSVSSYSGPLLAGHVDFTGLSQLTHIECYHTNINSLDLTGCTSLSRLCVEAVNLTSPLDLNPVRTSLYDLRAANQQAGSLVLASLTGPLENLYHFCVRSQALTGLPSYENLPAIQQLWIWQNSLNIDELAVRSSRPLDSVRPSRNAHPGIVNVIRRLDLAGQTWAETFQGEPEQRIDAWGLGLQTVDFTSMGPVDAIRLNNNQLSEGYVDHVVAIADGWGTSNGTLAIEGNVPPSDSGLLSVASLQGRGWTVTHDEPIVSPGPDPEPPTGTLLWADEFERADATGWEAVGNGWLQPIGGADLSISDGQLVVSGGSSYQQMLVNPDVSIPSNLEVELELDHTSQNGGWFGVLLRCSSTASGTKCLFSADPTTQPRGGSASSGSGTTLNPVGNGVPASWTGPGIHKMRVRLVGTTMSLYLDDVLVGQDDNAQNNDSGSRVGICGQSNGRSWRAIRVYSVD